MTACAYLESVGVRCARVDYALRLANPSLP